MDFGVPSEFRVNLPQVSRSVALALNKARRDEQLFGHYRFRTGSVRFRLIDLTKDFVLGGFSPDWNNPTHELKLKDCFQYRDGIGSCVAKRLCPASLRHAWALLEHQELIPFVLRGLSRLYFLGDCFDFRFLMTDMMQLLYHVQGKRSPSHNHSVRYELEDHGLPFAHIYQRNQSFESVPFLYFDVDSQRYFLDCASLDTALTPYDRLIYVFGGAMRVERRYHERHVVKKSRQEPPSPSTLFLF